MPAVVAGGITKPEMPAVVRPYAVKSDTSTRTTSKSYVAMGGMSITVEPEVACDAIVMFSGVCQQYSELKGYVTMGIALYLDGVRKAETLLSPYATLVKEGDWYVPYVSRTNATLITAFKNLPAGTHTFQMYFRGASDVAGSSGLAFEERAMQVVLFYR